MNSDDKDLSPEEIQVNEILDGASKRIEQIDNQIKTLPPDKPPTLEYRPPGAPPIRSLGTRAHYEAMYRAERETLVADSKAKSGKIIENSSPGIKQKVGEKVERWQNPKYKEKHEEKDISQAQENLLSDRGKADAGKGMSPKDMGKTSEASASPQSNANKMSMRFTTTLGYTKWQDKSDKSPNKAPDKSADKSSDKSMKPAPDLDRD